MSIKTTENPQIPMQFYIVTGGKKNNYLASTEILKVNGGTAWTTVASLPFARRHVNGLSIPNGHFLVSGGDI